MPEPQYKGNTSWKIQRGTSFGTDDEGKDFIELNFRGRSDRALQFYAQYPKGTACPEPGFSHCKLLSPPNIDQDGIAFSTALLRFEGASPLSGNDEGTDATIDHSTQEAELICSAKINRSAKGKAIYKYHRVIVTAKYIKETRPSSTRYDSELNHHADDLIYPIANVDVPDICLNYNELKKSRDYKVATWSTIASYSETTPGVFEVSEEHTKYLVAIEDQIVNRKFN